MGVLVFSCRCQTWLSLMKKRINHPAKVKAPLPDLLCNSPSFHLYIKTRPTAKPSLFYSVLSSSPSHSPPWPTASFILFFLTFFSMSPTKFINLLALIPFAVFCLSLNSISANALAVERTHVARNLNYAHAGIAKKRRSDSLKKRCKPRPHSTSHPSSTSTSLPHVPPSPSPTPSPSSQHESKSTHSSSPSSSSPTPTPHVDISSGSGKLVIPWSNNEQSSLCNFRSSSTQ